MFTKGQTTFKEVIIPKKYGGILNRNQDKARRVMAYFKIDLIFNVTNAKSTNIFIRNVNIIYSTIIVKSIVIMVENIVVIYL